MVFLPLPFHSSFFWSFSSSLIFFLAQLHFYNFPSVYSFSSGFVLPPLLSATFFFFYFVMWLRRVYSLFTVAPVQSYRRLILRWLVLVFIVVPPHRLAPLWCVTSRQRCSMFGKMNHCIVNSYRLCPDLPCTNTQTDRKYSADTVDSHQISQLNKRWWCFKFSSMSRFKQTLNANFHSFPHTHTGPLPPKPTWAHMWILPLLKVVPVLLTVYKKLQWAAVFKRDITFGAFRQQEPMFTGNTFSQRFNFGNKHMQRVTSTKLLVLWFSFDFLKWSWICGTIGQNLVPWSH